MPMDIDSSTTSKEYKKVNNRSLKKPKQRTITRDLEPRLELPQLNGFESIGGSLSVDEVDDADFEFFAAPQKTESVSISTPQPNTASPDAQDAFMAAASPVFATPTSTLPVSPAY